MTKEEQLIYFLLDKYKSSKTNVVSISKNDLSKINLSEQETVKTIYILQEDGFINIKDKSVHDDLSRYWNVALNQHVYIILKIRLMHKKRRKLIG